MSKNQTVIDLIDERLDRLTSLDIGGRGVEHLYLAARQKLGNKTLIGAAAVAFNNIPDGSTILMTAGWVSRAWISAEIGENDGPAGAAIIARALSIGKRVHCVVVAEATLIPGMEKIFTEAGLTVLPFEQAKIACADGTLAVVSMAPFTTSDEDAVEESKKMIDRYQPTLLFSTERVGRAEDGKYYSMRAIDYGMGRSRIDYLFDEAVKRQIPTVAVGDGGNEIGMGAITEAVHAHVKFGDKIAAISKTDVIVTAACSNWGCYAIAGALAARRKNIRLINTPELERNLLLRGVDVGLINSVDNVVDPNVDGINLDTHVALVELISAVIKPAFK